MAIYTTDTTPRRGLTVVSKNDDYGEIMEWSDLNPDSEDRVGYFVCFDHNVEGLNIRKAGVDDDVRGVSITSPAFASNATPDKYDDKGLLLPQYTYVGWTGFVPVIDNGTCTVGGRCMPDSDGTAIPSSNNMGYQVIERIDANRVLILVEPQGDMIQRIKGDIVDLNDRLDKVTSYSTDEVDTGATFADGKKIYKKTLYYSKVNKCNTSVSVSGLNIDTLINCEGTGDVYYTENSATKSNGKRLLSLAYIYDSNSLYFTIGSSTSLNYWAEKVYVTLWYTKAE